MGPRVEIGVEVFRQADEPGQFLLRADRAEQADAVLELLYAETLAEPQRSELLLQHREAVRPRLYPESQAARFFQVPLQDGFCPRQAGFLFDVTGDDEFARRMGHRLYIYFVAVVGVERLIEYSAGKFHEFLGRDDVHGGPNRCLRKIVQEQQAVLLRFGVARHENRGGAVVVLDIDHRATAGCDLIDAAGGVRGVFLRSHNLLRRQQPDRAGNQNQRHRRHHPDLGPAALPVRFTCRGLRRFSLDLIWSFGVDPDIAG